MRHRAHGLLPDEGLQAFWLVASLHKGPLQGVPIFKSKGSLTSAIALLVNALEEYAVGVDAPTEPVRKSVEESALVYRVARVDHLADAVGATR